MRDYNESKVFDPFSNLGSPIYIFQRIYMKRSGGHQSQKNIQKIEKQKTNKREREREREERDYRDIQDKKKG